MTPQFNNTETLAKQISVKSAVNPCIWMCLVISIPLFLLSSQVDRILSLVFVFLGSLPILAFIFSFIYLLFTNPNYLRSEDYQLRAETLKIFGDKDNPFNATAGNVISVITNPSLPALNDSQSDNTENLGSKTTTNE